MFCTFPGNRQGHGHSLHGHRRRSVPTSNPNVKHKLESTWSQLTGSTIKRVAAESSRTLSKGAVHCCHKPALTHRVHTDNNIQYVLESVWLCVYVSVKVCGANLGEFKCFDDEQTASNCTYARMRNKNRLPRQNKEGEEPQFELDKIEKLHFLLFSSLASRHLLVCVRMFCCVHCAPAPSMHPCGTMALRSESRLRRSGAGTTWDKRAALFHFFPPSIHLPLMSFD